MNLPAVAHRSNREDASAPQAQGLGARVGQPLRVFVACGMKDPVLGAVMRPLANKAWGGIGYHWHPVPEGGHFVQEVRVPPRHSPPLAADTLCSGASIFLRL